jgi:hypothetical protein
MKNKTKNTSLSEQCRIERKRQNQCPLTNKYITFHFPGMGQTLQDKVAWLTISRIKNVIQNQAKNVNFKSSLNILGMKLKLDKKHL